MQDWDPDFVQGSKGRDAPHPSFSLLFLAGIGKAKCKIPDPTVVGHRQIGNPRRYRRVTESIGPKRLGT